MPGMTEWTQKRGEDTSTTDFASLKAAEKLYGKKLALNKDYQDRIQKLAKQTNLKTLQEELKNVNLVGQARIQKEQDIQRVIDQIQRNAYEGAAANYKNFAERAMSEYAIEVQRQMIAQEKENRASIERQAADELAILKEAYPNEAAQKTEAFKEAEKEIAHNRKVALQESFKIEADINRQLIAKEKTRNEIFIKGIDSKVKQRQKEAEIAQENLANEVKTYKDMVEAGVSEDELKKQEAVVQQANERANLAQFKANITKALTDSIGAALNKGAQVVSKSFSEVESIMSEYNAPVTSRLQGSGKTFSQILDLTVGNTAASPFVKTTEILRAVKQASEQGIAYNIEQRAFLATISDKIAETFNAFDSNLTRLIRLQQADTTAARLGMEASLTKFFNNMFQDTSYLGDLSSVVSGAIIDANSQLDRASSAEFEYVVQKWLGSLSALGMSSTAVSNIAEGINYLATGNVQALAGNNQLQTLFAMSSSRAGLSYADLLLQGLDAKSTNKLLESMVTYLKEIAEGSSNKVVRGAYGNIFNLSASDFRAIQNLTSGDIQNISSNVLSYTNMVSELNNQFRQLTSRTTVSEMISNISSNAIFGLGKSIYENPGMYAMMKMLDAMDDLGVKINIPAVGVMGNFIDLNTDVNSLMRMAIGMSQSLSLLGTIMGSIGAKGGLDLSAWGGTETTQRGTGIGGVLGTLVGGTTTSTYVGTGSSRDIKKTSLSSATDEASETSKITNKNIKAEKTFDDFYYAVIGTNAKEFIKVRETYLSQAYDENNGWIKAYDDAVHTELKSVFGTTSFFDYRLKVSDNSLEKYAEGNVIRVVDSGLTGVTSALMEVRNATKAQTAARASIQTVNINEESIVNAILKALMSQKDDGASLQQVLDLLQKGDLEVKAKPRYGNYFQVQLESVSPTAKSAIRE